MVLRVKLWFSGVDTARFHNLFSVFRHWPLFHVFFFSFSNVFTLQIEAFKGIDYGFNGFDTPFSRRID